MTDFLEHTRKILSQVAKSFGLPPSLHGPDVIIVTEEIMEALKRYTTEDVKKVNPYAWAKNTPLALGHDPLLGIKIEAYPTPEEARDRAKTLEALGHRVALYTTLAFEQVKAGDVVRWEELRAIDNVGKIHLVTGVVLALDPTTRRGNYAPKDSRHSFWLVRTHGKVVIKLGEQLQVTQRIGKT